MGYFDIMDVPRIHQGSCTLIFRSLHSSKLAQLLDSPGHHPCSLKGRWWFLRGVFVVFDMVDDPRIHQGSYILILSSLPSWEVLHLLCVSRASTWSLRGRWMFLGGVFVVFVMVDVSRIHQGSYIAIFTSLTAWESLHLPCAS